MWYGRSARRETYWSLGEPVRPDMRDQDGVSVELPSIRPVCTYRRSRRTGIRRDPNWVWQSTSSVNRIRTIPTLDGHASRGTSRVGTTRRESRNQPVSNGAVDWVRSRFARTTAEGFTLYCRPVFRCRCQVSAPFELRKCCLIPVGELPSTLTFPLPRGVGPDRRTSRRNPHSIRRPVPGSRR